MRFKSSKLPNCRHCTGSRVSYKGRSSGKDIILQVYPDPESVAFSRGEEIRCEEFEDFFVLALSGRGHECNSVTSAIFGDVDVVLFVESCDLKA